MTDQLNERPYLLERVDEAAVVQVYADDFERLPLNEKRLIWHLYQAALAGRDIYYDQRYAHNLDMRATLEAILRHPEEVAPETLAEIVRYTKLFWINTGPYNFLTARKFVLRLDPAAFAAAAHAAARRGGHFPLRPDETLDGLLQRLRPMFFDLEFEPMVTNKTPGAGRDMLAESANNLYRGVTLGDLDRFDEQYELNSRLVKQNGHLTEEVYRIGGKYGAYLHKIVEHLEAALPFCTPEMTRALEALIKFYRSGSEEDRRAYDVAWVADQASPVDTINGFIEVYLDVRGCKGAWEALVFYVNAEKTRLIQTIAAARAVVRGSHAVGREIPASDGDGRHGAGDRRRDRKRRSGAAHADWHQSAERSGDSRAVRQQVGVAVERARSLRQVAAGELQARVLLVARGAGARRALGQLRERDRDQSPRGRRPRLGRGRRAAARQSAGGAAGALFGDRGDARRSGRVVFHRRSEDGGAGADRRGAFRGRGARGIRRLRAHGARAVAAAARGRDDRGRSHAQPSGDRALADGEHVRHRAPHA